MKVVFENPTKLVQFYDPEHQKWLANIENVPIWSKEPAEAMHITLVDLSNLVRQYPALEDCEVHIKE